MIRYTNELSNIDTPHKAYLLGLIMADGCIYYNKQSGAYCTTIKLKESDKYLLEIIQKHFPFFRMGKVEISKDGFKSYYINHYNKLLFNDLQKHGILPRKSKDNADKVFLPALTDDLFFAYLHGLFDGDGTIYQSKEGHIRIEVIGMANSLFNQIHSRLNSLGIVNQLYYRKARNYYMIRLSTKVNVQALLSKFSTTPLLLERKFKPFFTVDWDRIPEKGKKCELPIWFATTEQTQTSPHS